MTSPDPMTSVAVSAKVLHRRFQPETATTSAPGRLRVPAGLLGMIVLVMLVEGAIVRGGTRFVDPVSDSWAFSGEAARQTAPTCDLLCVGDSLVKHGMLPRVLAAGTGRPSYNLAAPAGPTPITYFLLRRALDSGARPSAVVFDVKPSLMVGSPRFSARYFPHALELWETWELILTARSAPFAVEMLLGKVLPSYRARFEVRDDVRAALKGTTTPYRALAAIGRRNWTINLGANAASRNPMWTGEVPESYHVKLLSDRFHAHRVNAAYAHKTARLLAERGIPAYLLIPPFTPQLRARRELTGSQAKYLEFVHEMLAQSPQLTVLDASQSEYPAPVFVDPIHLNARGALTLSQDVATVLRAGTNERWVRLPDYRDTPPMVPLEEVEQSRERLGIRPAG